MFWFGLLLTICYVPGYTGASVQTQWALLSATLPISLWLLRDLTSGHKLFFLWCGYAAVGALWSHNGYSTIWGLWLLFIWMLSFNLGSVIGSLIDLWKGMVVGLGISSAVALVQFLGYSPVLVYESDRFSGLLFNSTFQGACIALVLVAVIVNRLWLYTPALVLGLILANSRGAYAILALGLATHYARYIGTAFVFTSIAIILAFTQAPSDLQRLQIWGVTFGSLSTFGAGVGSFTDLHYATIERVIRPEFAHNDFLQLIYEYGIFATIPFAIFAIATFYADKTERPILIAFIGAATFYFPLYAPITSFIGFVLIGYGVHRWPVVRFGRSDWRPSFLSRLANQESRTDLNRREAVPLLARVTTTEAP